MTQLTKQKQCLKEDNPSSLTESLNKAVSQLREENKKLKESQCQCEKCMCKVASENQEEFNDEQSQNSEQTQSSEQQSSGDSTKVPIAVKVDFRGTFDGKSATGKIDTGADVCCLHATNINMKGDQVSFTSSVLSDNTITMPLASQQSVKTADGGESSRPVVKFDITINGNTLDGVMFNLNDRSDMEDKILIGMNALEKGNFVVDTAK